MANMLSEFVERELSQQVKKNYPHMQNPSGMYAKITQVCESDGEYVCTLKLLDKSMNEDNSFPEIPQIRTTIAFKNGDIAVVLLLYGGSSIFIVGRY